MDNAICTNGNESQDSVGLLTGLLFGGLAGFGIMMFLAPRSGKETRARIALKRKELQNRASDTLGDLAMLSRFDNRQFLAGTYERTESG